MAKSRGSAWSRRGTVLALPRIMNANREGNAMTTDRTVCDTILSQINACDGSLLTWRRPKTGLIAFDANSVKIQFRGGMYVNIALTLADDYTVSLIKGGEVKEEMDMVYCDMLGEVINRLLDRNRTPGR